MKVGAMYSHLNGFEWIQYHQKAMWDELERVINTIKAEEFRTKYYEGALYDLARQGRGVPAVPLVLLGIEP